MKDTRENILQRALELFNEKGIEYGGMRELAALLGIRVSNITYYFATKDDIVSELMARLAGRNNEITQKYAPVSLKNYLEMYRELFHHQYKYRCLYISFVHLFTHHKTLADQYKQTEKKRKQRIANACDTLATKGYMKQNAGNNANGRLVAHISLLARFWLSEAVVSYYNRSTEEVIRHYLQLLCDIFLPYATAKGKKDIEAFLKEIQ